MSLFRVKLTCYMIISYKLYLIEKKIENIKNQSLCQSLSPGLSTSKICVFPISNNFFRIPIIFWWCMTSSPRPKKKKTSEKKCEVGSMAVPHSPHSPSIELCVSQFTELLILCVCQEKRKKKYRKIKLNLFFLLFTKFTILKFCDFERNTNEKITISCCLIHFEQRVRN